MPKNTTKKGTDKGPEKDPRQMDLFEHLEQSQKKPKVPRKNRRKVDKPKQLDLFYDYLGQ